MKIKFALIFICLVIFAHETLGSNGEFDLKKWIIEMPGFGANPVTTPVFFAAKLRQLSATTQDGKRNEIVNTAKQTIKIDEERGNAFPFLSPQSGDTPLQAAERAKAYQIVLDARTKELAACFGLR